jgi:hypothetical protein
VAVSDTHAYVSDSYSGGLQVIDITDPANPQTVGSVDTPGSAVGVSIQGNYAYLADGDIGVQVIDITNPTSPQIVGGMHTPGLARGVAVSGMHAYIADDNSGLVVIDIANPASPQMTGSMYTPGSARGVAVSGAHAYVADYWSGLMILPAQCDEPSGVREYNGVVSAMLLRAYPNPATWQTLIRLEIPNSGPVQASVFDMAGRRIRELFAGILSAGLHDLPWDGRDYDGRAVSAGVYLVRVATTEGTGTTQVVLLK